MPANIFLKAAAHSDEQPGRENRAAQVLERLSGRDGYAFFLCAVDKRYAADLHVVAALVGEQVERLARAFGGQANVQHRFEQFLSALNERLAEESRSGTWTMPIEGFHAVVGVACESEMYLSGNGDLSLLFLHREDNGQYNVFNLSRNIQTEQAKPSWEKPFAVILDGSLQAGDIFCAASRNLQPIIPGDELNDILTALPPLGALSRIRQYVP